MYDTVAVFVAAAAAGAVFATINILYTDTHKCVTNVDLLSLSSLLTFFSSFNAAHTKACIHTYICIALWKYAGWIHTEKSEWGIPIKRN